MTIFCERIQFTHGATPHTFDGNQTITLNDKARKLHALVCSHSLSARAADEGHAAAIRMSSDNWSGTRTFPFGWIIEAETATNAAPSAVGQDIIALDIDVGPSSKITADVSTILGATQTGTVDAEIGFLYSDGNIPADVLAQIAKNNVPFKGGGYGYVAALTTTVRTALSIFTIPSFAQAIVGGKFLRAIDTAVTADEEVTGYIELDFGVSGQGVQNYPTIGGVPQDGTDAGTGAKNLMPWIPMYVDLSQSGEVTVNAFINAKSAITGGADYSVCLGWR